MGQAKADTEEAKKQIDKAVNELDDIKEELINLKDINTADLDKLGKLYDYNFNLMLILIFLISYIYRTTFGCCGNGSKSCQFNRTHREIP